VSYLDKLKSRKFQALIGGIFIVLGTALTGYIEWAQAIYSTVGLVLAYLGIEGSIDFVRAKYGRGK